jgi:uncharacterized protein with PQ loop repeat
MTQIVSWASSIILLLTIIKQIHKQWSEGDSKGVSKWLFIGQFAASAGFVVYSVMVRNWVFIATNALMALSAIVGLGIVFRQHRSSANREAS